MGLCCLLVAFVDWFDVSFWLILVGVFLLVVICLDCGSLGFA